MVVESLSDKRTFGKKGIRSYGSLWGGAVSSGSGGKEGRLYLTCFLERARRWVSGKDNHSK